MITCPLFSFLLPNGRFPKLTSVVPETMQAAHYRVTQHIQNLCSVKTKVVLGIPSGLGTEMELFHMPFRRPYSEISNETTQDISISGPKLLIQKGCPVRHGFHTGQCCSYSNSKTFHKCVNARDIPQGASSPCRLLHGLLTQTWSKCP